MNCMATILWCYLRNDVFKQDKDYHLAADLTGQANHLALRLKPTSLNRSCLSTTTAMPLQKPVAELRETNDRIYTDW